MNDNGQIVAVGLLLLLLTGTALAFGGLLDVPSLEVISFDLEANQVEVIGFDSRLALFNSVSVEIPLDIQSDLPEQLPEEKAQFDASMADQAQRQAELQTLGTGHSRNCGK